MSMRFRLALAGAFAVLAVLSCLSYADDVREQAETVRSEAMARYGGETVELVVANKAIEAGDTVEKDDVQMREWLSDLAPTDALTSLDDVVGATVSVPAAQGAPLTKLNFRDEGTTLEAPSGHVAVSVPLTDKIGIARDVAVGSSVIAYRTREDGADLLASGLEVLSAPGTSSSTSGASIVLAVSPGDVAAVLAASASGDLRLVVPADDVDVSAKTQATTTPETASSSVPAQTTMQEGDGS